MDLQIKNIAEREFERRYSFASNQYDEAGKRLQEIESRIRQLKQDEAKLRNEKEDWRLVMVAMNYAKTAVEDKYASEDSTN